MPKPAKVDVTDSEIDAALVRARKYAKYDRRVLKAVYSKTTDSLRLILNDGATYTVPCYLIQGLTGAQPRELGRIQIVGDGTGLLWPLLDVAHYAPGLLQGVFGTEKWMTAISQQRRKLKLVDALRTKPRR